MCVTGKIPIPTMRVDQEYPIAQRILPSQGNEFLDIVRKF